MLCTLVLAIGGGLGFIWPTKAQQPQLVQPNVRESQNPPVSSPEHKLFANNVIFDYQPDSPLQPENIIDVSYAGGDEIGLTLKNISNKTIRAYGFEILSYPFLDSNQPTRNFQGSSSIESKNWIPAQATVDNSLGQNFLDASKVVIRLDFIEFADGTTWGKDTYHYHDMVLGFRAGMLAATQRLLAAISNETNLQNIDLLNLQPTKVVSEGWLSEFKNGVQEVRSRISNVRSQQEANAILSAINHDIKLMLEPINVLH
jgi:hypothetical protein